MSVKILPENRVRSRCSWETYERLVCENESASAPRFTFDRGWLEIMGPSMERERVNEALRQLVNALADHLRLDLMGTGSTTFRRADLQQGFEPDSSFYVHSAPLMRGVQELDLNIHPAPELVIEIDISRSSQSKLELYRAIGVGEVWRWTNNQLSIVVLGEAGYLEAPDSHLFPRVRAQALSELVVKSAVQSRADWNLSIQAWLRLEIPPTPGTA